MKTLIVCVFAIKHILCLWPFTCEILMEFINAQAKWLASLATCHHPWMRLMISLLSQTSSISKGVQYIFAPSTERYASKSLSRKVCSLGGHICKSWKQNKKSFLNSQLNNTFQISNKIWHDLSHKCCFLCSISIKKKIKKLARPANGICSHKLVSQNSY